MKSHCLKKVLNVVIKQNCLHQLCPTCVITHTNTHTNTRLCHVGPENNNTVLLTCVIVTNEGVSHDVCVLSVCVCVWF